MIYKPFALLLLFKVSIAKIWNLVQSKKNPLISHKTKDCLVFLSLAAFDVYFIVKLGKHEKKFLFSSLEKLIFALNTLFLTISEMIKDRKNRNKKNNVSVTFSLLNKKITGGRDKGSQALDSFT